MHCNTPEDLVGCMLDVNLRQITHLKIYGRSESYIFASGVWACTRLCRLSLGNDVVSTVARGPCPDRTIYEPRPDSYTTVQVRGTYSFCDYSCSNANICGNHSFVSVGLDRDVEKAQVDLEWDGLTTKELVGMLRWYRQSTTRCGGYMGTLLVDFDDDAWM